RGARLLRPHRVEPAKTTGGSPADSTERSTRMPKPPPVLGRDGGRTGHGSCRPPDGCLGRGIGRPEDEGADGVAVEAKGQQRRGLIAGEPEILPVLRRQEGKLPVGGRLVQPAARLVGALVALMLIEPIVGRREA